MTKFTMSQLIQSDESTFWKLTFDKEMNPKMVLEGLGFPGYELVSFDENDKEIVRKVKVIPKVDLPAAIKKVVGDFRYTETMRFDKAARVATFTSVPDAGKMKTEGTVRVERAGDKSVRRVVDVAIEAKAMLIGGLMESSAEKALKEGWEKGAAFINAWIKEKGL
jgi:hypothetical protein